MVTRALLAVLLLGVWQTNADAIHTVTICGETCSSGEQCNLGNNLSCATNPAVTLNGGADFDFKGKTITCSSCSSSASAILVTAANSTVDDSTGGGGVRGAWGTGVNCQLNSNSIVTDVKVDGPSTGIGGCRKVQGAVVTSTTIGISNTSIGSTDYIKNSYVAGSPTGIKVEGSGAGLVDHNVIANASTDSILTSATTSSSLTISGNTLFTEGGGTLIHTGATQPTRSGNVCGAPDVTICGNCITAGDCEAPETLFVGP